jgi:DtxR family Mn-dependent transcriptional regulator
MIRSFTEENYLKAIFKLSGQAAEKVSTNAIAEAMQTKASSVTDMLKKLGDRNLVIHKRYQGVQLTENGQKCALDIVRKHRLWEVFLVDRLGLGWEEVHDIAEQLEHTNSDKLYEHLDRYLGQPRFDPHGDPIPDKSGKMEIRSQVSLLDVEIGVSHIVEGVTDHLPDFLQYLQAIQLIPGSKVIVNRRFSFDGSAGICIADCNEVIISRQVAAHILVKS